ncbi:L-threonylcarbamoyladenylate synthase [Aquibaculum arenosum]|uniref:Threonylcarbamoyl-AMP synthase n=1 Tax=Aquibaculum arenosum TaxID=3032591 RepID=A0ABT5YND5_9PROT|nr:L-threonylcarbamoyladenylate synthase [Fodinicurvata sp. CAU 1616]MDF2096311.1 L-threonylcarbamoyladenylate synthase [Fodinicurvata sp. CAU 1616]
MINEIATEFLPAGQAAIARAAELLRQGALVAFPTETVYGLGADATDDKAVARIFEAKGRPRFNPLICHYPDAASAKEYVHFDARAERLAERFWPGALTLVLPRRDGCSVSLLCSAGLDSLAVRVPAPPLACAILEAVGRPVAAPSANRSGRVSPTSAAHVAEELKGRIELIVDGGPCPVGVESTVVSLLGDTPLLLRPGGIAAEAIAEALGEPLRLPEAEAPLASPGMLASHYAPERPLRLSAQSVETDEALLSFGPQPLPGAALEINLSESGDLQEAAARLFASLRALDRANVRAIAVMPIPDHGLGQAINDRLRRAAAPR